MQSHAMPCQLWERVSSDLFQLNGSNNLVLVNHHSDHIELKPLKNTSAVAVIRVMKRNYARHGIPDECVTDNGLQFVSHAYARFAPEYGFTSIKSSPYHSRGNRKAESAVKIAKNILKKSRFEDPCLTLFGVSKHAATGIPVLTNTATDVAQTSRRHPNSNKPAPPTTGIKAGNEQHRREESPIKTP